MEDKEGDLWIGTSGNGIAKFDRENERFAHYRNEPNNPYSISNNSINSIYKDRFGIIWIGTYGGGLNKLNREKEKFDHYRHILNEPNSLNSNDITAIYQSRSGVNRENNILWVGTFGAGLNKIDRKKGVYRLYEHDPHDATSLSDNHVMSIFEDREGTLWIGTYGGGLNKLVITKDHRTGKSREKFVRYVYEAEGLTSNYIYSICEDNHDNLWIGTAGGGVSKFDHKRDIFTNYVPEPDDPNSLSFHTVSAVYKDRAGTIWIGTLGGGLNKLVPPASLEGPDSIGEEYDYTFLRFKHDFKNPASLSNDNVLSIYEDKTGSLWIGTEGGGLNQFDKEKNQFTFYTEQDGLPNDVVNGILEDDSGCLWVSTNNGLSKFCPRADVHSAAPLFRNYDVNDGLQGNKFNHGACYKSQSGEMFFGGDNGFNGFFPDRIKDNTQISPIVLTSFTIFNEDVKLDKHISKIKELDLSHKDRVFSFKFASLDFTAPRKNKYAFMLEGVDKDWNYVNADRRFVTYTNIHGGDYIFRVKGSNSYGVWNEEGISLKITVTPPFWEYWWIRSLFGIVVIFLVYMIFQRRVRFYKKEREKQEKFSQRLIESQEGERKRIASELHDSLGQNLLLINNELQQIRLKRKVDIDEIEEAFKLVKESMNEVRAISYALHPHQLDKLGLRRGIESSIKKISHATKIKFEREISDVDNLLPRDKEIHFYRILQEVFNNILKHSKADTVQIRIHRVRGHLMTMIKDNGRGFDTKKMQLESSSARGLGLHDIKERANILNCTFRIRSNPGMGTEFEMSVPLENQAKLNRSRDNGKE